MANGYGRSNDGFGISRQESVALIVRTAVDNGVTDPRQIAYMLATAQHETRNFTAPDEDFGRQQAKKLGYRGGEEYFGRGYVHLTHIDNYQKFDRLLGLNGQLVSNPALAKEPEMAAKILVIGMCDGLFTGKPLSRYINDDSHDTYNARRVVNGVNPKQPWSVKAARECATHAQQWEKFLTPERMAQLKTEHISSDRADTQTVSKDSVRHWQSALNQLGYKGADGKPLAEDGISGMHTRHAIKAFQQKQGLDADGVIGPKTAAALEAATTKQLAPAATASANAPQKTASPAQNAPVNPGLSEMVKKFFPDSAAKHIEALGEKIADAVNKQLTNNKAGSNVNVNVNININIHGSPASEQHRNLTLYCASRCAKENLPLDRIGSLSLEQNKEGKNLIHMCSSDQQQVVTANADKGKLVPAEQSIAAIQQQSTQQQALNSQQQQHASMRV